ncbi:glycoside hydrolase family 13 protein [Arsenicicoccus dermatophilus]|uniref:glycoside hydrolase family 13 protein n=1 Tax=Arsenicicoccus dermatophilus TaxID=1076331 RepID=UPI003916D721
MTDATVSPGRLVHPADSPDAAWWRDAVIYQVYPRSFADSDGDGMGDLPGVTARLPYLRDLGVDALWLSPFYTSPQADAGYDVADYRQVDPTFGTLADAEAMIERAHELGLRVIVDLVPNHTSARHPWFQAALAAAPGSPERERYLFRDGRGPGGQEPPTDWRSVFGGPAWTRTPEQPAPGRPAQWYLNLFDSAQPDLDWEHPDVRAEFAAILAYWLDRGVDGFRVDVAHGLVKDPTYRDWDQRTDMIAGDGSTLPTCASPYWDQDGVHEIYRAWRRVLDSYNPQGDPQRDRILCAEAWVEPVERLARYTRPDEMHQAFNFAFLESPWVAGELRGWIEHSLTAADAVGAPTTWVLSNHDVVRHATRLGYPADTPRSNGIRATDPQPDAALGLRRARAATALMLALPGSAYLYQGEELGLPEHTTLPDELRQDPTYLRTKGTPEEEAGRDGCRIPLPWAGGEPGCGFGPGGRTWLPQPESYAQLAADRQAGVEGSTLELYRTLLRERRARRVGRGSLTWLQGYAEEVVALAVTAEGVAGRLLVVTNLGSTPVGLPAGAGLLVASGPLTADGLVPTDTTVWLVG